MAGPSLVCPGCSSRDVDLRCGLLCGTCAAAVATTEPPETATQARYTHKGCGGVMIWDLSGGFCTGCHAEGLDMDDVEQRETAP